MTEFANYLEMSVPGVAAAAPEVRSTPLASEPWGNRHQGC